MGLVLSLHLDNWHGDGGSVLLLWPAFGSFLVLALLDDALTRLQPGCHFYLLVLTVGLAGPRRAVVDFFRGLRNQDGVFHKAREFGLLVDVREAKVLL